jgi:hypothetical protein
MLRLVRARSISLSFAVVAGLSTGCASSSSENLGVDQSRDTAREGYCRSTTCKPPDEYPTRGLCQPPNWSTSPTCIAKGASNAPLWWRNECVGYSLNEKASSRGVGFDGFAKAVTGAFAAYASVRCAEEGRAPGAASIRVEDLGPVACAAARYDRVGPNQNVITFQDDTWPHDDPQRTIALTTVTFDPRTGEIYDADIELNSANHDFVTEPGATSGYDLQAVLTHEVGHFYGLAHAPSIDAVMYARGDTSDGEQKRTLTANDVAGFCAIYPPGGVRAVSALVDASQQVKATACNATPRHGFSARCDG